MDIFCKKICGDFAILYDYINGGYIYDINQFIQVVGDIKSKSDAIDKINELKLTNLHLLPFFEKMESSKDLRYILASNLHDAVIQKVNYINDDLYLYLDLSEVKTLFYSTRVINNIVLIFNKTENVKVLNDDLINRTIMNFDLDIVKNDSYIFTFETYDCTPANSKIFECIKVDFLCRGIHISI